MSESQSVILRGPIPIKNIEPYYKIALKEAAKSPCVRRKYGVTIIYDDVTLYTTGFNDRVTRACNTVCVRERYKLENGSRTELGAEVHAEQAALIGAPKKGVAIVLAGLREEEELKGVEVYPCLVCARMVKYAGYGFIYMKNDLGLISPVSIHDIIEYRESEIGPPYEW